MTDLFQYYILNGHKAFPVSKSEYTDWLVANSGEIKRVAREEVRDALVSTVFLGLDHGWRGEPPMLFETLVFGGPLNGEMERCTTWEQAEAQHAAMVARVKKAMEGEE